MYDTQIWGTPAAWMGSVGIVVGLVGVAVQVNSARRVSYGQFVHELDKDYRSHFRDAPQEASDAENAARIFERVVFFEKVKVLLDQKVIKLSTIDALFAGRFFALAHSHATHDVLKAREDHVATFFALHAEWVAHRKKQNEPIPLQALNLANSPLFAGGQYQQLVAWGNKLSR